VACVGRIVMDSKTMNEEKRFPYEKSTWAGARASRTFARG
jgi:hypothetical protein